MKNIVATFFAACLTLVSSAQSNNTTYEVIDYREVDGKMIVKATINGVIADFAVDLAGHMAVLPEYVEKLGIDMTQKTIQYSTHQFKNQDISENGTITTISVGNSSFGNKLAVYVAKEQAEYLRKLGVAGIVSGAVFRNNVLTIDSDRKKLIVTSPYRPDYIRVNRREGGEVIPGSGFVVPVTIDGKKRMLLFDNWQLGTVEMTPEDFAKINSPSVTLEFIGEKFTAVEVVKNSSIKRSVLGAGILKHGLLSLDYQRNMVYFQPFGIATVEDKIVREEIRIEAGKVNPINKEFFIENIFDYRSGGEFVSKFDKPVVIDFWATWCGPCMKLLPVMEQLAERYKDRVVFMKVDADREKELCSMYKIQAIPAIFFIAPGGKPTVEVGDRPEKIIEIIEKQLLK